MTWCGKARLGLKNNTEWSLLLIAIKYEVPSVPIMCKIAANVEVVIHIMSFDKL